MVLYLNVHIYFVIVYNYIRSYYYYYYYYSISSPGLRRGHVKKNAFHVKGVGEIVNQTVKSDRAIAPLLKTNNSTEGRQVEIS